MLIAVAVPASAQTSAPGIVLSLSAQGPGTVTSDLLQNLESSPAALRCTFNMLSHTGSPSTTYTIQAKSEIGDAYYDLLTSAAVTDDNLPAPLFVGASLADVANQTAALPAPRSWRVSATVSGGGATVTGGVHCRIQ